MKKYYKKFYEVGNNSYYLINFNNDNYLAIESFIEGLSPILRIKKRVQQGLKLLELTPCISILFQCIYTSKPTEIDEEFPDMNRYEIPDEGEILKTIKKFYEDAKDKELENLNQWYANKLNHCKDEEETKEVNETYTNNKEAIKNVDMFKNMSIDLKHMEKRCPVLTSLRMNGLKFLYMQNYTTLYDVVYMYEIDVFGTVTIYKFDVIKGKIKSAESFIIGKGLLNAYYEFIFKKEN